MQEDVEQELKDKYNTYKQYETNMNKLKERELNMKKDLKGSVKSMGGIFSKISNGAKVFIIALFIIMKQTLWRRIMERV